MAIEKETTSLGMPWEEGFGYAQAVRVGDTIYLAGQVSHDAEGNIVGAGDMAAQMRQAYANVAEVLERFGATMDNVVDETMFVTDVGAAMEAAGAIRREVFGGRPAAANTLIQISGLAFPELMIEIKCIAKL
ncbi:MAG: Rid family hydrolase [Alphaproteobacteria bacterium]|nr:Rid family hydrolase [Alphaproteobacteria bacterium]